MVDKTSSTDSFEGATHSLVRPELRPIGNLGRLPGARRSLFNLDRIARLRSGEGVRLSSARVVNDLAWRPAHGFAIERDTQYRPGYGFDTQIWHSGHVNAVLSEGATAIVGTQTGGVWLVNPLSGTGPITQQYQAIPLSDDWDNPDVNSLAYVSGSTSEFFAGCASGGALYHVELDVTLGAMLPRRSTRIPLPFSVDIVQILVIAELIVLATDNGIWSSAIPQPASNAAQYNFSRARGLPVPDRTRSTGLVEFSQFSGLAEGPDQTVVAAAWGADVARGHYGIFVGTWDSMGLTFQRSAINGLDETKMLRTSIDSSAANRNILYAVAANDKDLILGVLRSEDGGASWVTRTTPTDPDPSHQGSYNNCIAASPLDANTVVLAWCKEGPYYSTDGAITWTHPRDDNDANLHADNHAVHFSRNSPTNALFVGSDGGVVRTRDFGQSYNSEYNRHLATLQFYENNFDVSSRFPGLIAGGTQDNGNVYCNLRAARLSWKRLEGGDGDYHRFVDALGVLLRYNNTLVVGADKKEVGNRVRIAPWKAYAWDPTDGYFDGLGDVVPVDGNRDGLGFPLLETVRNPSWSRNGMKMYAVAAEGIPGVNNGFNGRIFGFFANDDGSGATFSFLKDIGTKTRISSMGSFDGTRVLIGTESGELLTFDPGSGAVSDVTPSGYSGSKFKRIDVTAVNRAFALHDNGRLLHFDGTTWTNTSAFGLTTFIADPRPGSRRVFAASDSKVYVSDDDGANWADASQGLPARPHCSDLRIGANAFGGHDLYLATYGRSVFIANIDYLPPPQILPRIPEEVVKIIGAVPRDGPGYYFVNGQLLAVPPRGPIMDILSALAIADLADRMSPVLRQRMRHSAFGAIEEIAQNELGRSRR